MVYLILLAAVAIVALAIWFIRWAWMARAKGIVIRALAQTIGVALLASVLTLSIVVWRVFPVARRTAKRTACITQLANIQRAMKLYEADQGALPSRRWVDAMAYRIEPNGFLALGDFSCPESDQAFSYTMNEAAVGARDTEYMPPLVLLFDGVGGKNSTGSKRDARYRHLDDTAVFLLADGHTKVLNRIEANSLDWTTPQSLARIELIVTDYGDESAGIAVSMSLEQLRIHYASVLGNGVRYYLNEPPSADELAHLLANCSKCEVTIVDRALLVRSK